MIPHDQASAATERFQRTAGDASRALLAFAAAAFVFQQHLPSLLPRELGERVDLVTPFAVLGSAAWLLVSLDARGWPLALALGAAVLYADGHGIHLAADALDDRGIRGGAEDERYFWDEQLGHAEWHLGWLALIVSLCLAERARPPARAEPRWAVPAALLLGVTLLTNTVEGQTWPLMVLASLVVLRWARPGRPVAQACGGAFLLAIVLLAVWMLWHGGDVPEFSDPDAF